MMLCCTILFSIISYNVILDVAAVQEALLHVARDGAHAADADPHVARVQEVEGHVLHLVFTVLCM